MTYFTDPVEKLERDFRAAGIPTDTPGFYDHPNFLTLEREDPDFLDNYASYVQQRRYDAAYRDKACREIPLIAEALHAELAKDGRTGACVDASNVLSRILEREGFWNFCVKGSLTITFPKGSGIPQKYFWSVDTGSFTAGAMSRSVLNEAR